MAERIAAAAAGVEAGTAASTSTRALRPDQVRVFHDFAAFLLDVATSPSAAGAFGRIVLPPRTGKTVVAGHIIDRTGLRAVFLVPTRTLVEQTARELQALLPSVPVGVYSGERKDLRAHGVNVATYSILLRDHALGALPPPIASSALVFADEAHRAMTPARMDLLHRGFEEGAVRVALTATPDYDDERVLCRFFPALIHEVTLEEAMALDLLAPARVWVAEVDAEGSRVRILAGDYEEAVLGRVMSTAPFARAVEVFRYRGPNARLPALLACASRQQAHDLGHYLRAHRPAGAPAPKVVLGDTPPAERARILAGFEAGKIDTLIQVGVLLEGWNSPRCKLLLDLAPTLSRVRATQKYFRVMTRHEGAEARIYVLVPRGLPELPILPTDLFGRSCSDYVCGDLLGRAPDPASGTAALDRSPGPPVAGVTLKSRIVLTARLTAPTLAPGDTAGLRAVLRSCPSFREHAPCNLPTFRALRFDHPLFTGRGDALLRWLGVRSTVASYASLLARAFPGSTASGRLLDRAELPSCRADARHLLLSLPAEGGLPLARDADFAAGFRALTGQRGIEPDPAPNGLDEALLDDRSDAIACILLALSSRDREVIVRRFGLYGRPAESCGEIAETWDRSGALIGTIERRALARLRRWTRREGSGFTWDALAARFQPPPPPYQRGMRALAADVVDGHHYGPWTSLPVPLPARALLRKVAALLQRLKIPADVTRASPWMRRFVERGVEGFAARWEAAGVRVDLVRLGHLQQRRAEHEVAEHRLRAVVSGLREAQLVMVGPPEGLRWWTTAGRRSRAVEATWAAVCGSGGGASSAPSMPRRS